MTNQLDTDYLVGFAAIHSPIGSNPSFARKKDR